MTPIDLTLDKSSYYLKYYKSLLSAEKKAENKGAGLWAGTRVPLGRLLMNKLKNLLPFSL